MILTKSFVQVTIGGCECGRSYLWINVLIVFIIISAFRTKNIWLCPKVNVLWLQWLCQSLPLFVLITFLGLMWTPLDFPPSFVYSISCIFIGALATRTCCYNLLIICNVILCWLFYQFPVTLGSSSCQFVLLTVSNKGFQDLEDLYAFKQWTYSHPLHCLYDNILSKAMDNLVVMRVNY